MPTEAYNTYWRLQEELKELTARNLDTSVAAQRVKKLMRAVWNDLSESERFGIDAGMPTLLNF